MMLRSAHLFILAIALLVSLVACARTSEPQATTAASTPAATARATHAPPTPAATVAPTPDATESDTAAPRGDAPWTTIPTGWTEVAAFDSADGTIQVLDLASWSGGFMAIGLAQRFDDRGEIREPRIWTSADGVEWAQTDPDLGSPEAEVTGMLVPDDGGVVLVGLAGRRGSGEERTAAWRSADGVAWSTYDLPSAIAGQMSEIGAVSGPLGHLLVSDATVWYSSDLDSWELVLEAAGDTSVSWFDAGDEGFAATAESTYASGDGRTWYEAAPVTPLVDVTALRGDWYASGYTDDPATISIFSSANGLQWNPVLDVNDLTPPDGPKAGRGMESGITGAFLAADAGVLMLSLSWNHCCLMPEQGVAVFASVDGVNWSRASLPGSAFVSSIAGNAGRLVIAGHVNRGERAVFWVAEE